MYIVLCWLCVAMYMSVIDYEDSLSGLVSLVRRPLSSNLRDPGFKSRPGTVGGKATTIMWCSTRLKTSFELNPVTESKQGPFLFLSFRFCLFTMVNVHQHSTSFAPSASLCLVCFKNSS